MLRYEPEERITIGEVLEHPWLHKTYEDLDPPAEWISTFDWGRDTTPCQYNFAEGSDEGKDEEQMEDEGHAEAEENTGKRPSAPETTTKSDDEFSVTTLLSPPTPKEDTEVRPPCPESIEPELSEAGTKNSNSDGEEETFYGALEYQPDSDATTKEETSVELTNTTKLQDSGFTISARRIGFARPPGDTDIVYYAIVTEEDSQEELLHELKDWGATWDIPRMPSALTE